MDFKGLYDMYFSTVLLLKLSFFINLCSFGYLKLVFKKLFKLISFFASRDEAIDPNLQGSSVIKAKQLMDATISHLNQHKQKVDIQNSMK